MAKKPDSAGGIDYEESAKLIRLYWQNVTEQAAANPSISYTADLSLREAVQAAVNHHQVSYRFCLPTQLLGKVTSPNIDCLRLQRKAGDTDTKGWDARSLASKVVAPFNHEQEDVLGSSGDPYVGNPMRIPKMERDDPSKKDIAGWNNLVTILEEVESQNSPAFTLQIFQQTLLDILHRQAGLRFEYPVPPRTSLDRTLEMAAQFLNERSGGDRALALCGALFDAIGKHFGLYTTVERARINASDTATDQAADLECTDAKGQIVLAVEVKDRELQLVDVEGTLLKSRKRGIKEVLFTAPKIREADKQRIHDRVSSAFTAGENLYVFDFVDLARAVLALGGEPMRQTFLIQVGHHLNEWNTQPKHRKAWKDILAET